MTLSGKKTLFFLITDVHCCVAKTQKSKEVCYLLFRTKTVQITRDLAVTVFVITIMLHSNRIMKTNHLLLAHKP